jgi:hypothetical protein
MHRSQYSRLAGCFAAAAAALALTAPLAQAATAAPLGTTTCAPRAFAPVFVPWHDSALYTLAGGGDFEAGAAGWTLAGPAAVASGSSPYRLGAAVGARSLELRAGASAVSPAICVGLGYPGFRFVARSATAGQLRVDVLYADGSSRLAGWVQPGGQWTPVRKLSLAQGLFDVARGESALVRIRIAAVAGTVRIDDVYVDPRYTR